MTVLDVPFRKGRSRVISLRIVILTVLVWGCEANRWGEGSHAGMAGPGFDFQSSGSGAPSGNTTHLAFREDGDWWATLGGIDDAPFVARLSFDSSDSDGR
jgi:hypothetical protein